MKIFFDHQTFSNQTYGGISRYIAELIKGINSSDVHQAYLSILFSNNLYLNETDIKYATFFRDKDFFKKLSVIYRLNEQYCKLDLKIHKYDVFHSTYYDPYFISSLRGKPFVVTFHDMIHERFAEQYEDFNKNKWHTAQKRIIAERATRIIAVSESTKSDLINLFDIDPGKIKVVYHGSSLQADFSVTMQSTKIPLYLLYVGNRQRYKNFQGMLRSIASLLKQHELTLICAGGGVFEEDEQLLIQALRISTYIKQVLIDSDETLRKLYESALGFIFPSKYEGFGIPVLEAFACSCPCLLSNTSSLPEVAGEAALYFDPDDDVSINNAVEQLISYPELRHKLIQAGIHRLSEFSWERTVQETLSVYATCL